MPETISRRSFLGRMAVACAAGPGLYANSRAATETAAFDFPLADLHVHLDNSTLDKVVALSKQLGIKFGIVEHAGTKENKYPVVLSNDEELTQYLDRLEGQPVYKGVQAEWVDWMSCFSKGVLARLDYVLTDAMTIRNASGQRVKMWESGFEIGEKQKFMDRYVDWHVEIMATEPLDVFANLTWLPATLMPEYDTLWTTQRMEKIIRAALQYGVALEISSSFKAPRLEFLKTAKAAGAKFSLGSNGRYPNMGKLDYSLSMARSLGLQRQDMFVPPADGQKAVQRRKF
jgi:histidinol phosphatase-like PHP family hydrolase